MTDELDTIETTESTLGQFTGPSDTPIIVIEEQITRKHHEGGGDALVGFRARTNRGLAYVSPRTRDEHLYRKEEAYCLSLDVIEMCHKNGWQTVFIGENDTGTMYEYDVGQFYGAHSFPLSYEKGDPQRGVPVEYARSWDASEVRLS